MGPDDGLGSVDGYPLITLGASFGVKWIFNTLIRVRRPQRRRSALRQNAHTMERFILSKSLKGLFFIKSNQTVLAKSKILKNNKYELCTSRNLQWRESIETKPFEGFSFASRFEVK